MTQTTPSTSAQGPVSRLPHTCPHCGTSWKFNRPAEVAGSVNAYRCIECKFVYHAMLTASPASPSGVREAIEACAKIADAAADRCRRRISAKLSNHDAALFESAAGEAHDIAAAIRASLASDATPAATSGSEDGGEAVAFIAKLVHMQSGQGWSRAVVRDAAANFLKLRGIAITGQADTTAEIAALAKPASEPAGGDAAINAAVEAMEDDLFIDDIPLQGTSQNSARLRHYATIAVKAAALSSSAGPAVPVAHPAPATVEMRGVTTAMIDAAMVEMKNLHPPMRRSECERLIRAALAPATEGRKG